MIRYLGSFDENFMLYFSEDDVDHMHWSGLNPFSKENANLTTVFLNSYQDAHPPLRNILVNLIFRFIDNVNMLRLVAFIPGVLLLPTSFLLGYSFFLNKELDQRLYSGLILSFLVANMETLILLSIETRPYSLMLLFEMLALISLLFVLKRNKQYLIAPFYIFSLLAIFADYSALVPIGGLNMILLSYVLWNKDLKRKILSVASGSILLIAAVVFQFILLTRSKYFDKLVDFHGGWIQVNYMDEISDIPRHFVSVFKTFFSYPGFSVPSLDRYTSNDKYYIYALTFLAVLFLLGLIYSFIKKEYLLFSLPVLIISIAIFMAYLKLAPFGAGRQNLYLLPFLLIPIFSFYALLLETSLKPLFKGMLIIVLVLFPWSQGFSLSLSKTIKSFTSDKFHCFPSTLSNKDLLKLSKWVLNESNSKKETIVISCLLKHKLKHYLFFRRLQMQLNYRKGLNGSDKRENKLINSISKFGNFEIENVINFHQFSKVIKSNSKYRQKLDEILFVGSSSSRKEDHDFMKKRDFILVKTIRDEGNWYVDLYKKDNVEK